MPPMRVPTPQEVVKFTEQANRRRAAMREAIIGSFEQVAVEGFFIELRMAHPAASRELPEMVNISKCAEMDDRAFFHLVCTHRGGGMPGLLNILHETQELIMRQLGASEPNQPEQTNQSQQSDQIGKEKSPPPPTKGEETKP
jgi:hypothetical protein